MENNELKLKIHGDYNMMGHGMKGEQVMTISKLLT